MTDFKIGDIKEDEVYFFNVSEEDKPSVLEKYQSIVDAREEVYSETAGDNDPCCEGACDPFVPFCLTVSAPNRTKAVSYSLGFDLSCVKCVIEPCLLHNATVTDPCGGKITGCDVSVNRVRAVGSLTATLGLGYEFDCGGTFGDHLQATETETFCVDNILCYTCCSYPCPDFCNHFSVFGRFHVSHDPCGNCRLTLSGVFILPDCKA